MNPNQGWQQQPHGYGPPPPQGPPPQGPPPQGPIPQGPIPQGYGPPQGFPPGYGPPPPGYGPQPGWGPPRPPSIAPAIIAGVLFALVSILCFVLAGLNSADGKGVRQTPEAAVALIGMGLPRSIVSNGDPVIVANYIFGGVFLLLAGLTFARLGFARWIAAALGFVVVGYYVYAVIRLAANDAGTFLILPAVALVLWIATVVVAVLPPVGRAMRGYRPKSPY